MKLPSSMLQISPWRAFQGKVDDFTGGHRIIIIYPYDEYNYCYLTVTSKVEKAKLRCMHDLASLVEFEPDDWDALTCHSCVECNKWGTTTGEFGLIQVHRQRRGEGQL